MSKIYRSAQGKMVNMEELRLKNEATIAVGNMKVNARGDELGPGGIVVKTRNEAMDEYYAKNAIYTKENVEEAAMTGNQPVPAQADSIEEIDPTIAEQDAEMPVKPALRGSLADAVAKSTTVEQKLLTPKKRPLTRI
jgi:hypothetical protein